MRLSIARRNLGLKSVSEVIKLVQAGDAGMINMLDSMPSPEEIATLDTSKTYLVPNGSDGPDKYTEYRVIDGQLEPIGGGGSASVDLTDYVKKDLLPNLDTLQEVVTEVKGTNDGEGATINSLLEVYNLLVQYSDNQVIENIEEVSEADIAGLFPELLKEPNS